MAASRRTDPEDETPDQELEFGDTLILGPEIERLTKEARLAFEAHDYVGCVRTLGKVPESMRSAEARDMKKRAAAAVEEIGRIRAEVKQALEVHAYDGLIPRIERFLELKPGDRSYHKLLGQLREREAKREETREESRTEEPSGKTGRSPRPTFRAYANELLRYLQVGAFAGGVLGALIGGFWRPEGYVAGGILGGLLAAANEWLGDR